MLRGRLTWTCDCGWTGTEPAVTWGPPGGALVAFRCPRCGAFEEARRAPPVPAPSA